MEPAASIRSDSRTRRIIEWQRRVMSYNPKRYSHSAQQAMHTTAAPSTTEALHYLLAHEYEHLQAGCLSPLRRDLASSELLFLSDDATFGIQEHMVTVTILAGREV